MSFKVAGIIVAAGVVGVYGITTFVSSPASCEDYNLDTHISTLDMNEPEYDQFLRKEKSNLESRLEVRVDGMYQQGVAGKEAETIRDTVYSEVESSYSRKELRMIKNFNRFNKDLADILRVNKLCDSGKVQTSAKGEIELVNHTVELSNGTEVSTTIFKAGERSFNPYKQDEANLEVAIRGKIVEENEYEIIYSNLTGDAEDVKTKLDAYMARNSDSKKAVFIGVKDSQLLPYAQNAVEFWRDNKQYMSYNATLLATEYDKELSNSDFEMYDIVVKKTEVENMPSDCRKRGTTGCAPIINGNRYVESPATLYLRPGLEPSYMKRTMKHELGHMLGLGHGEGPGNVMDAKFDPTRIS